MEAFSDQSILKLLCATLLLFTVIMAYILVRLIKTKRRCLELQTSLKVMEKIGEEFGNIRHRYNNLFQSIVFYIENEQAGGNQEILKEIMDKTFELNNNNKMQLINIKNYAVRNLISQMEEVCYKNGIELNIKVFGKVDYINMQQTALCSLIETIFSRIYTEVMRYRQKKVIIEVSSKNEAVAIAFDCYLDEESGNGKNKLDLCRNLSERFGHPTLIKLIEKSENVIFNSYLENDYYRQELMIV